MWPLGVEFAVVQVVVVIVVAAAAVETIGIVRYVTNQPIIDTQWLFPMSIKVASHLRVTDLAVCMYRSFFTVITFTGIF